MALRLGLSKKQKQERRAGIGASEIAALVGLGGESAPKPITIYERKVDGREGETTLRMELGHLFEDPIARLYTRRTGRFLTRCPTLWHPTRPFACATPDRLVFPAKVKARETRVQDAERLLQIKTADRMHRREWGEDGSDEVREDHYVQCQWEMDVAGVHRNDLAVLFDRDDFAVFPLVFHEQTVLGLREIAERFMVDHVFAKVPPPPDASEQYADFLSRAWESHNEALKLATPEVEAMALRLRELELRSKAEESEAKRIKNELRAFIGEASGVEGTFGRITWKRSNGSERVDWEGIAREIGQRLLVLDLQAAGDDELAKARAQAAHLRGFGETVQRWTVTSPGSRRLCKPWSRSKA